MTKVKICGLFRPCDIDYINAAMPDYAGFVFAKSRRQVTKDQAENLRKELNPNIIPIGVFVNEEIDYIAELVKENIISIIQLHGQEDEHYINSLKKIIAIPIIKAIKVTSVEDIMNAQRLPVDFLLLDQGDGGTGKTFDWSVVSDIIIEKPFFLAGGMNIDNVEKGINKLKPFAIDISSGVETNGVKDETKIREIVRRIQNV